MADCLLGGEEGSSLGGLFLRSVFGKSHGFPRQERGFQSCNGTNQCSRLSHSPGEKQRFDKASIVSKAMTLKSKPWQYVEDFHVSPCTMKLPMDSISLHSSFIVHKRPFYSTFSFARRTPRVLLERAKHHYRVFKFIRMRTYSNYLQPFFFIFLYFSFNTCQRYKLHHVTVMRKSHSHIGVTSYLVDYYYYNYPYMVSAYHILTSTKWLLWCTSRTPFNHHVT